MEPTLVLHRRYVYTCIHTSIILHTYIHSSIYIYTWFDGQYVALCI